MERVAKVRHAKHNARHSKQQTPNTTQMKANTTTTTISTDTAARVYVGTYAKYSSGSLKGAWIDLDGHDADSFAEACAELHADESDPELMFQDFEGFPEHFYGESHLDEGLWAWLELDEDDRKLLAMYAEAFGPGYEADIDTARNAFAGTADSTADFAEQTATDLGEIPENLPAWIVIDWEASWNCNLRYDYATARDSDGLMWFFLNC